METFVKNEDNLKNEDDLLLLYPIDIGVACSVTDKFGHHVAWFLSAFGSFLQTTNSLVHKLTDTYLKFKEDRYGWLMTEKTWKYATFMSKPNSTFWCLMLGNLKLDK